MPKHKFMLPQKGIQQEVKNQHKFHVEAVYESSQDALEKINQKNSHIIIKT
jgi:hypothetical protein